MAKGPRMERVCGHGMRTSEFASKFFYAEDIAHELILGRYAFDTSFNIHIFIRYVKDYQPERYLRKRNEVGFAGIFASPPGVGCDNCNKQREDNMVYQDVIPLTTALSDYFRTNINTKGPLPALRTLSDLEPAQVVPFLKQHLEWRITDTASNLMSEEVVCSIRLQMIIRWVPTTRQQSIQRLRRVRLAAFPRSGTRIHRIEVFPRMRQHCKDRADRIHPQFFNLTVTITGSV